MKRSHMAKVVLKEKQQLLKLPQHMLLLDVRTRWNSLFLMMERFCEQFPAIQAAAIDQRLRRPMEKEKLARMGNDDLRKAEEFVLLMRMHYTSTLAVSSEKSPTCGQILPILQKLRKHYTVQGDNSAFVRSVKENIWNDLSKRYQAFLEEATVLDPRFKSKMDRDEIWERVRASAVAANTEAVEKLSEPRETQGQAEEENGEEEEDYMPPVKQKKRTALEELFEQEDSKLLSTQQQPPVSTAQRVDQEIQLYRSLPPIPTKDSASFWWWKKSDTLPVLSALAEKYLCVQASSTPSERVFSTAGDTLSPERSRFLPERANILGGPEERIYVPSAYHLPLMDSAHTSRGSGHPGSQRTLSLLSQRYWWPSMTQDISRYVKVAQAVPSPIHHAGYLKSPFYHHRPRRNCVSPRRWRATNRRDVSDRAQGILVEIETEDWLVDFSTELHQTPLPFRLYRVSHHTTSAMDLRIFRCAVFPPLRLQRAPPSLRIHLDPQSHRHRLSPKAV
ncbi:zinc finger BED domain-containing protein 4-like [Rhinichthys klamathensis goyatoka]|uniref:zinc finger BED domain-containing protein 4-like n=1 Tax=Rhinichthys klamathensis goyatoka TaxID=3034132 RepID=UPI0024B57065|nr:zinc finger BED domain-containing protein 4-like [Rhinichthys klamathensis goyatoka]